MYITPALILGIQIALLVAGTAALALNLHRDLMMLQQNSYRNERYVRWFTQSGESTTYLRIGACISLFLILVHHLPFVATGSAATVIMAWIAVSLVTRKYKKPLVMTRRAWRINITQWLLCIIAAGLTGGLTRSVFNAAAVVALLNIVSPLVLLLANIILRPVESRINRGYYRDAQRILAGMPDLKVVGITGSYGKTSTKHYLTRILQEKYDVLMTPGSFNTTMGVIRTVREYLKPYNQVFVVEMGAKQPGDIREICDLVHPTVGIVTAVGPQHLESFKTIENVQRTKFELVDALPADGLAVVNDDFEQVAARLVGNVECKRYAVKNCGAANYTAADVTLDATGTTFTVKADDGWQLRLHTRLVGECNISNLMAAVAVARYLGVEDAKIAYAVEKIEQVEHRLNMKRTAGGVTIIDDAYNSNPSGSRMALEVLGMMRGGRRIVVTPGMIELGDKQYELNRDLGRHCARNADVAIVVGQYNRQAILEGLADSDFPEERLHAVDSFAEAQQVLATMLTAGDTVLYENDLPDTFK